MPDRLGNSQIEALFAHTPLAVAATDAAGRMTLFSPALRELFGASGEDVTEEELVAGFELYTEDGKDPLAVEDLPLMRARHGEVVTDYVLSARRHDGELARLRCNAVPLREAGETTGAIVLVQDVTAEHAARIEEEKLRERLVVTINHELRTPLTTLLGHAELLQEHRDQIPAALHRSVEAVCRSAHDLCRLAEVISGLADLEAHARLDKRPGDVGALVRGCVSRWAPTARVRDVGLAAAGPHTLEATVDLAEMGRAVDALLDNAVHYAPEGSEVRVRLIADGDRVGIEVADAGSGIPVRDRPRLVRPFERGEHPRQPVNSKGLGLAIAHTVAVAHGGALVLGDNEPRGLKATLVLPRHPGGPRGAGDRTGGPTDPAGGLAEYSRFA